MQIKSDTVLPAPSLERVEWFERSYRVKLPAAYLETLLTSNGAELATNIFEYGGNEFVLERFLCLLDNPRDDGIYGWYDLSSILTQLDARLVEDENLVGMNLIPFAAIFGGDFVCLDYRESAVPRISLWFHEESDDFAPVTETIADSFEAFIEMLRS
jgi:hypothetical protein